MQVSRILLICETTLLQKYFFNRLLHEKCNIALDFFKLHVQMRRKRAQLYVSELQRMKVGKKMSKVKATCQVSNYSY